MVRVSGCSGPRSRSRTGSSAASWSRAPAASPASPVQRARLCADVQGVRVFGAEDPLADGQQRGELVAGPGRVARLPGPAGEVVPGGQGVRVLGAEDPLADGQQRGELIPGPGRIPRLPGPDGKVVPGGQGVRVFGAEDPLEDGQERGELVPGPGRVPRPPVQGARLSRATRVYGCSGPEGASTRARPEICWQRYRAAASLPLRREILRHRPMPKLVGSRAAWACGSNTANAGQTLVLGFSQGIAASITAAAACRQ